MDREEFDSGYWQERYEDRIVDRIKNPISFDEARDLMHERHCSECVSDLDWSEYDERVWREYCELESPLMRYVPNEERDWLEQIMRDNERNAAALSLMYLEY